LQADVTVDQVGHCGATLSREPAGSADLNVDGLPRCDIDIDWIR
jgi:hypothetical protein